MWTVLQYEYQNQLILFLKILLNHFFFSSITFFFSIVYYMLLPFEVPYLFCTHALKQLKMITKIAHDDLFKLLKLFKLDLELLLNLFKCLLSSSKDAKDYHRRNLKTYSKIKEILRYFHVIPLTPRDAIVSFLMLRKVPLFVWKYLLPYPKFIFEDTFSNAIISGSKIIVTLPARVPVIVTKDEVPEHYVLHLSSREYLSTLEQAAEENENVDS